MSSQPRPSRLFPTLAVIATLIAVEGLAWAFFAATDPEELFDLPHRAPLDEASASRVARQFDAELGWRKRHDTPFGERPREREYGRPRVAVFGDSFAYGQEVADDETWAEHLAVRLGGDVYNFGNGAYGMDQALLRFERDSPRRPTPIVVLAFISNDAWRNIRLYRDFEVAGHRFYVTKPRFTLADDQLVLVPNPARSAEQLRAGLGEPEIWRQVVEHDWVYARYRPAQTIAPRFLRFLVPGFWRAVADRRQQPDPWRLPEPRRIAEHILLRFHRGALDAGTTPVVVLLPNRQELGNYLRRGTVPPAVEVTRDLCADHGMRCLFPLFALGDRKPADVPAMFASGGHYAPETNRWLADYLHSRLAPISLGEDPSP